MSRFFMVHYVHIQRKLQKNIKLCIWKKYKDLSQLFATGHLVVNVRWKVLACTHASTGTLGYKAVKHKNVTVQSYRL